MTYLNSSQSQSRDDGFQRTGKEPALLNDLLEQVLSPDNIKIAWMKVKSNKGTPGIDKMTIEEFPTYAEIHWQKRIRPALQNGTYQPTALKRAIIEKDDGSERLLAIPTVCDRVIMKSISLSVSQGTYVPLYNSC